MSQSESDYAERAFYIGVGHLGIPLGGGAAAPVNLTEARRAFQNAVGLDDGMCDAWLGMAAVAVQQHRGTPAVVDRNLIANCYRTRARVGETQRRIGLPPHTLSGLYPAGIVNLTMRVADEIVLARAAILAEDGQYDDAIALIEDVKTRQTTSTSRAVPDYLAATIYMRTERWPDVLKALAPHEYSSMLADCANYLAGTACARLGMFAEASRRLDALNDESMVAAYTKGLLERGFIFRVQGDEPQARRVFEALHALRGGDPDIVNTAGVALADPTKRNTVVTEEQINARTDYWDPTTTPTAQTALSDDRRATLLKEAYDELADLIGLDAIKEQIQEVEANARVSAALREQGLPTGELTEHVVLTGPSGTGKTVVASILAKIYAGYGIVETDKFIMATEGDLVSKFVGETVEKSNKKIDEAIGGVLFVDEVHTLVKESREHNHGKEAIDTLLIRLENDRAHFVCLVAGYDEDVEKFLKANQGLRGRFTHRIRFESYSPDQLIEIADVIGKKSGAPLTDAARDELRSHLTPIYAATDHVTGRRRTDDLGNARFIRSVITLASRGRNTRLIRDGIDLNDLKDHLYLEPADIQRGLKTAIADADAERARQQAEQ